MNNKQIQYIHVRVHCIAMSSLLNYDWALIFFSILKQNYFTELNYLYLFFLNINMNT